MSGRHTTRRDANGPAPPWIPRLGDLAYDTAARAVGVIVDVPGEGTYAYHLSPPAGGEEWTAARDAATLSPSDTTAARPSERPEQQGAPNAAR
ncbi:hypothetical protein GCM10009759_52510 [Kitasatospora saccharophila]|uniref:Uncharacterized protein n=1 Tax=Kitasatospora saccharophila TaxID=407973 RepID=A0ABN2XEU8_9ACTN